MNTGYFPVALGGEDLQNFLVRRGLEDSRAIDFDRSEARSFRCYNAFNWPCAHEARFTSTENETRPGIEEDIAALLTVEMTTLNDRNVGDNMGRILTPLGLEVFEAHAGRPDIEDHHRDRGMVGADLNGSGIGQASELGSTYQNKMRWTGSRVGGCCFLTRECCAVPLFYFDPIETLKRTRRITGSLAPLPSKFEGALASQPCRPHIYEKCFCVPLTLDFVVQEELALIMRRTLSPFISMLQMTWPQ